MSRVGITIEGGLFAADLVERIAKGDTDVPGQDAKSFCLDAARLSAEIQSAFSDIQQAWGFFKRRREFSQASLVTLTREAWAIPLFERLGYTLRFQRAAAQIGGQSYPISHRIGEAENAMPVHIVAFDQKLGERGEARRSPHALLQEYLNKSDALWGIVTNGRELRLLRNSVRSSQPAYVAVYLEPILDGNLYNEFALAYRLLHRTRLPPDGGDRTIAASKPGITRGSKRAAGSARTYALALRRHSRPSAQASSLIRRTSCCVRSSTTAASPIPSSIASS
jgi:hypothetical protein